MNRTMQAVTRGAQWSGRSCCSLALLPRCQTACATASNKVELQSGCRRSDEQNLFSCLERQEIGEECCGNARTSDCLQSCKEIFKSKRTPTVQQRTIALASCNDSNPIVVQCIKNHTDITPNVDLKLCKFIHLKLNSF